MKLIRNVDLDNNQGQEKDHVEEELSRGLVLLHLKKEIKALQNKAEGLINFLHLSGNNFIKSIHLL